MWLTTTKYTIIEVLILQSFLRYDTSMALLNKFTSKLQRELEREKPPLTYDISSKTIDVITITKTISPKINSVAYLLNMKYCRV